MITRASNPILHFDDEHGHPLDGGYLCTYIANTSMPIATYRDGSGTKNPVQIQLDSRGECSVWLDPAQAYKFVLIDKHGNVVMTADNVTADTMTFVAQGDDVVDVVEETVDGKTIVHFSIKPHSIGRNELKNPRNFIPDAAYIQFKTFGDNIVVTLCDKLKTWLETEGYVADE